jgi:4-hydroxybutyryl-CoA dehydratase/vinylacetyl-CoA-Delta-isomerase
MMNGEQYRRSVLDGRATFFEGERVEDLCRHPVLGQCVDRVAAEYDHFYDPAPGAISAVMQVPRTGDEIREQVKRLHTAGMLTHVNYISIMTLVTAAGRLGDAGAKYTERIQAFVEEAQQRDVRVTQCITDAKGDRSRPPHQQDDPDAYTRVVERRRDGVVIRGAKLHISAASLGHELMTIPTKAMKGNEEDYAIACAVPVNAPGVKIVNSSYAPRHPDTRTFPFATRNHIPEGFVIFDDVFVPNERIFLDGETPYAAVFAHSLGLWERLGGLANMADGADMLVGFAQLIAEANGLASIGHIREKISEMIIHATLVRAAYEAALAHAERGPQGAVFPSELYTNAGKYHAAANYGQMVRHLQDIAGGSVLTAPTIADLENEETGPLIRKYMATMNGVDGEYRTRLFHAIRDLTADAYGGWLQVTNIQGGGGLFAQRIVTRKHYDVDRAKRLALGAAGLAEHELEAAH